MKTLFAGAVSALAILSAASASETPTFDLYRSNDAAQSLIAVAAMGETAPFSVAAGADAKALDILAADAANAAIADLKAKTDESALPQMAKAELDATHDAEKATKKKSKKGDAAAIEGQHKIVLVKQIAEDGGEAKVERRIIKTKKLDGETSADVATEGADAAETAVDQHADLVKFAQDDAKIFVIEKTENGAPVRLVKISGASADSARTFIDETAGLDDSEKAAMKLSLGL